MRSNSCRRSPLWEGLPVGCPDVGPGKGLPQLARMPILPLLMFQLLLIPTVATAGVPSFVTYSGRLIDGTGWGESTQLSLTFRIYDQETDGQALFEQIEDVVVQDGYFSVMLEDIVDVFAAHPQTWIGVAIDGGDELAPRQPVGSVPYAVRTATVDAIGPVGAPVVVVSSGMAGVGTDTPDSPLHVYRSQDSAQVKIESDATPAGAGEAALVLDAGPNSDAVLSFSRATDERWRLYSDAIPADDNLVLSSNDVQTVMVWDRDTGNVGIGETNPSCPLHVSGDFKATGTIFAGCQLVYGSYKTLSGNGFAQVTCPQGLVVLGGGGSCVGWGHYVVDSLPFSIQAWRTYFSVTNSSECRSSAICCRFGN